MGFTSCPMAVLTAHVKYKKYEPAFLRYNGANGRTRQKAALNSHQPLGCHI